MFMQTKMSAEEMRAYLSKPLLARLATSDNGWPHVTPVWFEYDGENFWIPTQAATKKATHVKKDKRVGIIIDTFTEPISKFNITQVVVKGEAELIKVPTVEGSDPLKTRTMSIWHRYLGDEPEKTLKKRLEIERYLIKIRPIKIYAIRDQW
jgi:nitroimidazol reductase NimA-like FMN-containing flavoprotein (pyridoxamine 5'-phosphate oxidase superfamily)